MKNIIFMQDINVKRNDNKKPKVEMLDTKSLGNSFQNETAVGLPQIHGRVWPD